MKDAVLLALIEVFSQKIQSSTQFLETTRKGARDAPGSNESHSDTSKFNLSSLAVGVETQLNSAREAHACCLQTMRALGLIPKTNTIGPASLFTIENTSNHQETVFILLAKGGGETVKIDGIEITSITSSAPIARAFIDKKEGEEIVFAGTKYKISKVE